METIQITVTGSETQVTKNSVMVSGTVGLPVVFTFDDAWAGLQKTAVFRANGKSLDRVGITDTTTVPWELLQRPGCRLLAGVYGTNADGSLQIPTVWADLGVIQPGADPSGDESADPTLPVWEQSKKDCVLNTPQTLTKERQAQARQNIGAAHADDEGNLYLYDKVQDTYINIAVANNDKTETGHVTNGVLSFLGSGDSLVRLIRIAKGVEDWDAATVGQLNEAVGNIETALDNIIDIQNSLLGTIVFYFEGNEYTAIRGMTWAEWCDSEYNTIGFRYREDVDRIFLENGDLLIIAGSQVYQTPDTIIGNGYEYSGD